MANLLYLVHRIPYPPDKGDKVRSFHLLQHLLQRHRVFLGTFIDDPQDEQHLDALRALCPDLHVERLRPTWAKLRSLPALASGQAQTLAYYRSAGMQRWVQQVVQQHAPQATVVFSSAMAQFAQPLQQPPHNVPMLVDFVDVDSAKWAQYAPQHRWPLSWLYAREGRALLAYERQVALQAQRSFFVTSKETELFLSLAPDCAGRVQALSNGVDAAHFQPDPQRPNPYPAQVVPIVFTGAMDYWPNIDAVQWFAQDVLPLVRQWCPQAQFFIVGRNPPRQVQALASAQVHVTGTVPDVRPYLQHAAAVVAPLRVARGIQNKILEAMAMAQPVVTVPGCADAIGASAEEGLFKAATPQEFDLALRPWLEQPDERDSLGRRARAFVEARFSWQAHLQAIDACLPPPDPQGAA